MRAMPVLIFILIAVALTALCLGAVSISLSQLLQFSLDEQQQTVLLNIRLPRLLLSMIAGSALAVAGAVLQGIFRNPLADPSLIGISSGAALAVAVLIVLVGPMHSYIGIYTVSLAAFFGGSLACWLIFNFARISGSLSVASMLLAGIALNALAEGVTGFLSYLSTDQQLRMLTFWRMGSFASALWPSLIVSASIILPGLVFLIRVAAKLNIILLGDKEAQYLGLDAVKFKRGLLACVALIVGVSVAACGTVGFVGLVVPHLVRLLIGSDHRILIPSSAILGAILVVIADTIARVVMAPAEIPVGIITSIIGGPFFLWLLFKMERRSL